MLQDGQGAPVEGLRGEGRGEREKDDLGKPEGVDLGKEQRSRSEEARLPDFERVNWRVEDRFGSSACEVQSQKGGSAEAGGQLGGTQCRGKSRQSSWC